MGIILENLNDTVVLFNASVYTKRILFAIITMLMFFMLFFIKLLRKRTEKTTRQIVRQMLYTQLNRLGSQLMVLTRVFKNKK